ncbi:MAG: DUF3426 domain-containing protein [Rhodospirillaceae bacterium]|nr:MAG: DUF3426 domain-containing protein [Rhodospirillaceae bacterium]
MIVSCPACGTSFTVDDSLIGPAGRKVRCAKCDHRWRQMPVVAEADAQDDLWAGGDAAEQASDPAADPFAEAAAEPGPAEPAAELGDEDASASDIPASGTPASDVPAGNIPASDLPAGDVPVMEPIPAGPAMPEIPSGIIRPREARPTGPITVPPKMPPMERSKRGGYRGLLLLLGIVIGLLAVAFFLRDMIARSIPGAEELYSLIGIQTGNPAEDLEISNIKIVKRDVNDKPALEISGDIFNISKYPVHAPMLRATPKDKQGKILSPSHSFRLEQQTLEPGETASFRTVYEGLPDDTSSVTVNFAE